MTDTEQKLQEVQVEERRELDRYVSCQFYFFPMQFIQSAMHRILTWRLPPLLPLLFWGTTLICVTASVSLSTPLAGTATVESPISVIVWSWQLVGRDWWMLKKKELQFTKKQWFSTGSKLVHRSVSCTSSTTRGIFHLVFPSELVLIYTKTTQIERTNN